MPELSPFLLLVLFFAVSWVSKRIKQATGKQSSTAGRAPHTPASPPSHFPEASPVLHKQPVSATKSQVKQEQKPREMQKQTFGQESKTAQEGQIYMGEPSWSETKDEKYQPEKRMPAPKARPSVIPQLTGSALVQAVVTHEILIRPRSAHRLTRFG